MRKHGSAKMPRAVKQRICLSVLAFSTALSIVTGFTFGLGVEPVVGWIFGVLVFMIGLPVSLMVFSSPE